MTVARSSADTKAARGGVFRRGTRALGSFRLCSALPVLSQMVQSGGVATTSASKLQNGEGKREEPTLPPHLEALA